MTTRHFGSHLIAGALLAGSGGMTVALAAIAEINLFATLVGIVLLTTGIVVMYSDWIPGMTLASAMWRALTAVGTVLAAPFRAYARLYRSQWRQ